MTDPVFRSWNDFLAPSPDANYGSVLPFAYNREGSPSWVTEGSNPRFALPEWLRSAAQGVVGLGESTQTGSLTPEALQLLTSGSVGTGALFAPRGALAAGASRPPGPRVPIDRDKFFEDYMQHVDIRGSQAGREAEEANRAAIMKEGFKSGTFNTLPPFHGGTPMDVIEQKYAPRAGQMVYLVPSNLTERSRIKAGWKPEAHEVLRVSKDYPDMYEEYLRAFREAYPETVPDNKTKSGFAVPAPIPGFSVPPPSQPPPQQPGFRVAKGMVF